MKAPGASFLSFARQGTGLVLEGRHNVDAGWIKELRMNGDALVIIKLCIPFSLLCFSGIKEMRLARFAYNLSYY